MAKRKKCPIGKRKIGNKCISVKKIPAHKWDADIGMESPGWYNERYINRKNKKEIIISAIGEHEGGNSPTSPHIVGFYSKDGQPVGYQQEFKNRAKARKYAKSYMNKN